MSLFVPLEIVRRTIRRRGTLLDGETCHRRNLSKACVCLSSQRLELGKATTTHQLRRILPGARELTLDSGDGERRLLAGEGDREREPEYERGIVVLSEQGV